MLPIRPMAECFFFFFCKFFFVNSRLRVFSTLKTLVYKICVDYKNGLESNKNIVLNKKKGEVLFLVSAENVVFLSPPESS